MQSLQASFHFFTMSVLKAWVYHPSPSPTIYAILTSIIPHVWDVYHHKCSRNKHHSTFSRCQFLKSRVAFLTFSVIKQSAKIQPCNAKVACEKKTGSVGSGMIQKFSLEIFIYWAHALIYFRRVWRAAFSKRSTKRLMKNWRKRKRWNCC